MISCEDHKNDQLISLLKSVEDHLKRNVVELSHAKLHEEEAINIAINTRHIRRLMLIENEVMR